MSEVTTNADRLLYLTEMVCDGNASDNDHAELDTILSSDATSRRRYWDYCRMHIALEMEVQAHVALRKVHERNDLDSSVLAPWESEALMVGMSPNAPPSSSPALGFLGSAYHGTVGFFSQEVPLSLLIAAVVMGMAMLGAWAYKISHYQPQVVEAPSPTVPSDVRPELVFVGRITGMVDCKWSDPSTEPFSGAYVPLGRKYALASGLMQITYDSGAKVILEGPCTYEVESRTGGYLSLGKLTAKVENERSEVRGQVTLPSSPSALPPLW